MIFNNLQIILLLAIAANLDNLGVGISYGFQKRYIPNFSNLIIAIISAVLTFLAMIFGKWLEQVLPAWFANDLGASIIIGVGLWICWESLDRPFYLWLCRFIQSQQFTSKFILKIRRPRKNRAVINKPVFENDIPNLNTNPSICSIYPIQLGETIFLGISLSLNAIAEGLGASLAGYDPIVTSLSIGIFSYITVAIGQKIPKKIFNKFIGKLSEHLSGLLLIGIGIYELIS